MRKCSQLKIFSVNKNKTNDAVQFKFNVYIQFYVEGDFLRQTKRKLFLVRNNFSIPLVIFLKEIAISKNVLWLDIQPIMSCIEFFYIQWLTNFPCHITFWRSNLLYWYDFHITDWVALAPKMYSHRCSCMFLWWLNNCAPMAPKTLS